MTWQKTQVAQTAEELLPHRMFASQRALSWVWLNMVDSFSVRNNFLWITSHETSVLLQRNWGASFYFRIGMWQTSEVTEILDLVASYLWWVYFLSFYTVTCTVWGGNRFNFSYPKMEESQWIPIKYSQGKGRIGLTWNNCCLYWLCLLDVAREIELHKHRASTVWETVGCALSLWYIKTTVLIPTAHWEHLKKT